MFGQASGAKGMGRAVVLVGDDDSFTHSLAELLEGVGHPVRIAVSARMALAEITRLSRPVVVCDLGASRMQAVELSLALRARGLEVPMVAISSMPNIDQHCRALGISRYIAQPFRLGSLLDLVAGAGDEPEPEHVTLVGATPGGYAASL